MLLMNQGESLKLRRPIRLKRSWLSGFWLINPSIRQAISISPAVMHTASGVQNSFNTLLFRDDKYNKTIRAKRMAERTSVVSILLFYFIRAGFKVLVSCPALNPVVL